MIFAGDTDDAGQGENGKEDLCGAGNRIARVPRRTECFGGVAGLGADVEDEVGERVKKHRDRGVR